MHMSTPSSLVADDPGRAVPVAQVSTVATTQQSLDRSQRSSRLYSYGIAVVFSLMLILLVVVGVMLWSPR